MPALAKVSGVTPIEAIFSGLRPAFANISGDASASCDIPAAPKGNESGVKPVAAKAPDPPNPCGADIAAMASGDTPIELSCSGLIFAAISGLRPAFASISGGIADAFNLPAIAPDAMPDKPSGDIPSVPMLPGTILAGAIPSVVIPSVVMPACDKASGDIPCAVICSIDMLEVSRPSSATPSVGIPSIGNASVGKASVGKASSLNPLGVNISDGIFAIAICAKEPAIGPATMPTAVPTANFAMPTPAVPAIARA